MLKRARQASFTGLSMLGKQPLPCGLGVEEIVQIFWVACWLGVEETTELLCSFQQVKFAGSPYLSYFWLRPLRPVFSHHHSSPPLLAPWAGGRGQAFCLPGGKATPAEAFLLGHHGLKWEQLPGAISNWGN